MKTRMRRIAMLTAYVTMGLGCDKRSEQMSENHPNTTMDAGMSMMTNDAGPTSLCPPLGESLLNGAAPFARGDMAFAYDDKCQRVYMFFGDKAVPQLCRFPPSDFVDEGWFFDLFTNNWSKLTPTGPAPQKRARPSGAWDSLRNRFLVFGGRFRNQTSGPYTFLNDLWAYEPANNQWIELSYQGDSTAPLGRMNSQMLYDPDNDRVIIYGGGQLAPDFSEFIPYGDLYEFSFATNVWKKILPSNSKPPARLFHSAALDQQHQRLYVFGGGDASAFTGPFYNDLWYFDFESKLWNQIPSDGSFPTTRIKAIFSYDANRGQIIMMGGHDGTSLGNNSEVWTLDLNTHLWELRIQGDQFNREPPDFCDPSSDFATYDALSPERRASHVFTITGDKAFMFGGRTDCGVANDTWFLNLSHFSWENVNESISGMTCYRSGRNNCDDPTAKMCG